MRELFVLAVILTFAGLTVAHCDDIPQSNVMWGGYTFDQGWTSLITPDPDAPSTAQPPVSVWRQFRQSWRTQWDPNVPMAAAWSPFKSPLFVIAAGSLVAATLGDVLVSQHDYNNGCGERHDAGRRPSMGEQLGEQLSLDVFVIGGSYFLKRKHIKVLPESFMLLGAGRHAYGMYRAVNSPCY